MRVILLLTSAIIFVIACNYATLKKEYYSDGTIKSEETFYRGKKHGKKTTYHRNGRVKEIMHYINDVLDGEYTSYDSLGYKDSYGYFWKGKAVGPLHYYKRDKLVVYNERDHTGLVYYVKKYTENGSTLLKEEGVCLTDSWFEDYTTKAGTYYEFSFFYAEPILYTNKIQALFNNDTILVEKTHYHLAIVKIPYSNHIKGILKITSNLFNQGNKHICQDSIIKVLNGGLQIN
jgi:hypothetical protein